MSNTKKIEAKDSLFTFLAHDVGLPIKDNKDINDTLNALKAHGLNSKGFVILHCLFQHVVAALGQNHQQELERLKADIRKVIDS